MFPCFIATLWFCATVGLTEPQPVTSVLQPLINDQAEEQATADCSNELKKKLRVQPSLFSDLHILLPRFHLSSRLSTFPAATFLHTLFSLAFSSAGAPPSDCLKTSRRRGVTCKRICKTNDQRCLIMVIMIIAPISRKWKAVGKTCGQPWPTPASRY